MEEGASAPGDYLYRSGSLKWDVESGMWGIFRVVKRGIECRCKNTCKKVIGHFLQKSLKIKKTIQKNYSN